MGNTRPSLVQRILFNVVVFLFFGAHISMESLTQLYVYSSAEAYALATAANNLPDNSPTNASAIDTATNDTNVTTPDGSEFARLIQEKVDKEGGLMVLYLTIAELLPGCITIFFFGYLNDRKGWRKFMMWLPCKGTISYIGTMLFAIYLFDGQLTPTAKTMMIIGAFFGGVTGQQACFLSGSLTYIAQTDTFENRAGRLTALVFLNSLDYCIWGTVMGVWVDHAGFVWPSIFALALALVALCIIVFLLDDPSKVKKTEVVEVEDPSISSTSRSLGDTLKVVFNLSSVSHKRMWLALWAFWLFIFTDHAWARLLIPYLQSAPLLWSPTLIGIFMGLTGGLGVLGVWPGIPLFSRCLKQSTVYILAMTMRLILYLIIAFAMTKELIFASVAFQIFFAIPWMYGMFFVSREVTPNLIGSVSALLATMENVMTFAGTTLMELFYLGTMDIWPAAFNLALAVIGLIPVMLLVWLRRYEKQGKASALVGAEVNETLSLLKSTESS